MSDDKMRVALTEVLAAYDATPADVPVDTWVRFRAAMLAGRAALALPSPETTPAPDNARETLDVEAYHRRMEAILDNMDSLPSGPVFAFTEAIRGAWRESWIASETTPAGTDAGPAIDRLDLDALLDEYYVARHSKDRGRLQTAIAAVRGRVS